MIKIVMIYLTGRFALCVHWFIHWSVDIAEYIQRWFMSVLSAEQTREADIVFIEAGTCRNKRHAWDIIRSMRKSTSIFGGLSGVHQPAQEEVPESCRKQSGRVQGWGWSFKKIMSGFSLLRGLMFFNSIYGAITSPEVSLSQKAFNG